MGVDGFLFDIGFSSFDLVLTSIRRYLDVIGVDGFLFDIGFSSFFLLHCNCNIGNKTRFKCVFKLLLNF